MTTAADVIAALNQRRQRKSLRPEEPGTLPTGWQSWLDAQPRVDRHVPGAPAPSLVAAFLERTPRPIPRSPAPLNRWQAFITLLRQNWEPDLREERGLRIGVTAFDIVLHILLAALLLWLMYLRFLMAPPQQQDEEAVQVEFIGRGNVEEGGGAVANAGADSAPASAAPARSSANPAPAAGRPDAAASEQVAATTPPAPPAEAQPVQTPPAPPQPVAEPAAQPLQVTASPTPPEPRSFQLPPPKERTVQLPDVQLREPQLVQKVEEVPVLRTQPVRVLQPVERTAQLKIPELRDQPRALDVPAPQRMPELRQLPTPAVAARQAEVRVPELRGEVRDIPMPPGGTPNPSRQAGTGTAPSTAAASTGAGGKTGTAPSAGQAQAGTGQGVRTATQGGRGVTAAGTGAGPGSKAAPGGWPGAAKSDDWGASNRNVAGTGNGNGRNGDGKAGVFNSDGSVRLPDEWVRQSGIDLDRSGTWLKRPGLEYKATRFDKYWIPQGTLLEEWVRRGIKKIAIPIPGTNTRLECVVSMLQLGGGCFPVNPDVNEQPAVARPPPVVPFKPHLQEDNGSVKPQDPPAPLPGG